MRKPAIATTLVIGAFGAAITACGSSDQHPSSDATGGSAGDSAGFGGTDSGGSSSDSGGMTPSGAPGTHAGGASASSGGDGAGNATGSAGNNGSAGTSAAGGAASGGASSMGGVHGSGGASSAGGANTSGGASSSGGASGTGGSGGRNIPTHCTSALPSLAHAADVSHPTTVVGSGTAASCTFSALQAAVAKAGAITFDCGSSPVTIPVTSTLTLSTTKDTVIDGGNTVTLDGQHSVQILRYDSPNWMALETRVTLQHLTLVNAKTTPTKAIPTAPSPCSQGFDDGEGGALYMRDGNLTVVDCTFSHNQAAQLGPDTGGGAIYITGSKHGAIIVGSVFTDNAAANAGAVGGLFAELDIYDSLFQNNTATGNGANNDDASKCDVINNGQHEVGSGGNGGAIYQDGGSATNVVLCGDDIVDNKAGMGAFGGGVFMTSNDFSGTMTVQDSTITGNTGGSWTQVKQGNTNLGSAFGVNAKSATVVNSMLQK
jgi:hypothetical protein